MCRFGHLAKRRTGGSQTEAEEAAGESGDEEELTAGGKEWDEVHG